MTGYIQWPDLQKFKPRDVVLNGGLWWRMDDAGGWHISDDSECLPICGGCGQPMQPNVLKAHQKLCVGRGNRADSC